MTVIHRESESQSQNERLHKQSRTELRLEPPQRPMSLLSISLHEVDELQRLIATGRLGFPWCSVVHHGGNSLLLKVLLRVISTSWRGWASLSTVLRTSHSIFLFDTTIKESSSTPRTEPVILMSLLILLASNPLNLLSQHTTAKIALATTDWYPLHGTAEIEWPESP